MGDQSWSQNHQGQKQWAQPCRGREWKCLPASSGSEPTPCMVSETDAFGTHVGPRLGGVRFQGRTAPWWLAARSSPPAGSPVPPRRPRAWLGRAPHAQGAACPFRGPRRKETRQSKLKQLKPHHLCCSEAHGQIHKYSKLLFRPGLMRFTAGLACGSSCEEPSDKLDCKSAG